MPLVVERPPIVFEDDDREYLHWTRKNARGYVVNCHRDPALTF
jgi:hypothetical protein